MNLIFTGMRGSGKSSFARLFSKRLGLSWLDLDIELEKEFHLPISEYVHKNGWEEFRKEEKKIIAKISKIDNHIIATGGGVILDPDNIMELKKNGYLIYLKSSVDTLFNRIRDKTNRPFLTDAKNLLDDLKETYEKRKQLYEDCADLIIYNDDVSLFDEKTLLFGVIGHPISHSVSPVLHNIGYKENNINARMFALDVCDIKTGFEIIKLLNISGIAVTIPHKTSIIPYLDKLDKTAAKIGAVNTVINEKNQWAGTNTDCQAAVLALTESCSLSNKKVAVIGAGGAARAVCYGLILEGSTVDVYNKTFKKAKKLVEEFGLNCAYDLKDLSGIGDYDIVINSTPLGMKGRYENKTPIPKNRIRKGQIVFDIVYNPRETRLIKESRSNGAISILGEKMILNNVFLQFKLFTGFRLNKNVITEKLNKIL